MWNYPKKINEHSQMANFSVYTRGRRWHQELYAKNMQNKENKQSSHFVIQCNGFNISYFSVFSYVLAWEKKSRNLSTGEQASSVGRGSKDVLTMMTDRDKSRRGKIKWGVVESLAAEFAPIMFFLWQLLWNTILEPYFVLAKNTQTFPPSICSQLHKIKSIISHNESSKFIQEYGNVCHW